MPPDRRAALFAAILAHDTIHPDAELPISLSLDYDEAQLAHCFRLSRELWETPGDVELLRGIAGSVFAAGRLLDEHVVAFKHVRARYKQLRFAYALFDERHLYPTSLDRATKAMSHLQDALALGRRGRARCQALLLRILLTRPATDAVERALAGFRPTGPAGLQAFVAADLARSRDLIGAGTITAHQFHAVRKTISRQAALYDCLRVLYPSPYHEQVSRYVSTINGLMGGLHDELVQRRATDPRSYARDRFTMPERIATMLSLFVERHRDMGPTDPLPQR